MTTGQKYWMLVIVFLIAVIAVGGIVIGARYRGSQPIEITASPSLELPARIYIGGAVNNPGFYPLKAGDSLEALVGAAGGTTGSADLSQLKLYLPEVGEEEEPQKVDLNRAEPWLLEALPGIGEVRAQAIVDYRLDHGRFHSINELTKVSGIGITTYQRISHLITVAD
jgi:competence protein ComEA